MSDVVVFTAKDDGHIFRSPQGYAIVRDGTEAPVYWKAYRPGGIDPAHEIAGGAGDGGWLKCQDYCNKHYASRKNVRDGIEALKSKL